MPKNMNINEMNPSIKGILMGGLKPINNLPVLDADLSREIEQQLLLEPFFSRRLVVGASVVCSNADEVESEVRLFNKQKAKDALTEMSRIYVFMHKPYGGIITQKFLELSHKDIEFKPNFKKCNGCDNKLCNPNIENNEWKGYDATYKVGDGFGLNKDEAYMFCLNGNGIIYAATDGQRNVKRELEIWQEEGRLVELSADYIAWLIVAEGNILTPYVNPKDNANAKSIKTVTLGIGVTFNMNRDETWDALHDVLGWSDNDINTIIKALFDRVPPGLTPAETKKYTITEQQSEDLLFKVASNYMEQVNDAVEYINKQNGYETIFKPNELEAMFDYAYNNGLASGNSGVSSSIDDDEYIIYYYLRKDQVGAVDAIIQYGNNGNRRRLNQANLFFNNTYNFVDSSQKSQLDTIRVALGWPPDKL